MVGVWGRGSSFLSRPNSSAVILEFSLHESSEEGLDRRYFDVYQVLVST